MMSKNKFLKITIFSFLAILSLNLDLSVVTSFDHLLIEGVTLEFYQDRNNVIHESILATVILFSSFSGNSVLWLGIFLALWGLFFYALSDKDNRVKKYSALTAVIFSLMYVIGFSINRYYGLDAVLGSKTAFIKSCIAFIGISLFFYAIFLIFYDKVSKVCLDSGREVFLLEAGKKQFFIRLIVILCCWMPYLIIYLPGIVNVDTHFQISQAIGESPLSSHHPIFLTGVFGMFYKFGLLFGIPNLGILLFSIFQMLICALAFTYVIHVMAKQGINVYIRIFTFAFFALHPMNAFYAITMYKDTLFGIVFMLLVLKTIQMVIMPDEFFMFNINVYVYSALCGALYLIRNNGLYIVIILLPALFLVLKNYRKKVLIVVGIFAAILITMGVISSVLNVKSGSIGEALSIPLQQIARVVTVHGDGISSDDRGLINDILPFDRLHELYDPFISDPVKDVGVFDDAVFRSNLKGYLSLWVKWFFKYPGMYIEAFLCQSHGYWYPDLDNGIVIRSIDPNHYGLHQVKLLPSFVEQAFSGIFVFRVFPVFSMLVSIGFAVWVLIMLAFILVIKREKQMLVLFLPVLLLWLTCIASPVSGMFRYIYGLFLVLPLLISVSLQLNSWRAMREAP